MVGLRRGDRLFATLPAGDRLVTNADQHAITYDSGKRVTPKRGLFTLSFSVEPKTSEAWWHAPEIPGKYGLTGHARIQRPWRVPLARVRSRHATNQNAFPIERQRNHASRGKHDVERSANCHPPTVGPTTFGTQPRRVVKSPTGRPLRRLLSRSSRSVPRAPQRGTASSQRIAGKNDRAVSGDR